MFHRRLRVHFASTTPVPFHELLQGQFRIWLWVTAETASTSWCVHAAKLVFLTGAHRTATAARLPHNLYASLRELRTCRLTLGGAAWAAEDHLTKCRSRECHERQNQAATHTRKHFGKQSAGQSTSELEVQVRGDCACEQVKPQHWVRHGPISGAVSLTSQEMPAARCSLLQRAHCSGAAVHTYQLKGQVRNLLSPDHIANMVGNIQSTSLADRTTIPSVSFDMKWNLCWCYLIL